MCQWSSIVGGEASAAGTDARAYTIVPIPTTRMIRINIGNRVPPWKRTRLPLPFWARRAARLVEDEEGIGSMRISGPLIEDSAGGDRPEASGDRYGRAPMVLRRKVIALAASAVVCASLVACSGDDDTLPSVQASVDETGADAGSVPNSIATGTVTTLAPTPTVTATITVAPTT